MKFGMPNLIECRDLDDCVLAAERFGLDFVEINMSFPQYGAGALDVGHCLSLSRAHRVFYTIHADEGLNPFDFNPRVSACYFDVMRDTLRFALAIGAPIVNLHLQKGIYVTLPDRVVLLNDIYREEYLTRVRDFARMCEETIGDAPLRVAIENVDSSPFTESQKQALSEVFMKSPVFALTLDTGHMLSLTNADLPVFDTYAERLRHMHLHDSDGRHAHLPLGEGIADVRAYLSRLPADATCLLEVKTLEGLEQSIAYLKKHHMKEFLTR